MFNVFVLNVCESVSSTFLNFASLPHLDFSFKSLTKRRLFCTNKISQKHKCKKDKKGKCLRIHASNYRRHRLKNCEISSLSNLIAQDCSLHDVRSRLERKDFWIDWSFNTFSQPTHITQLLKSFWEKTRTFLAGTQVVPWNSIVTWSHHTGGKLL